jgi:hypothetical protein
MCSLMLLPSPNLCVPNTLDQCLNWKIKGPQGEAFIFCSIPARRRDLLQLSPGAVEACDRSDALVFFVNGLAASKAAAERAMDTAGHLKPWAQVAIKTGRTFNSNGIEVDRMETYLKDRNRLKPRRYLVEPSALMPFLTQIEENEFPKASKFDLLLMSDQAVRAWSTGDEIALSKIVDNMTSDVSPLLLSAKQQAADSLLGLLEKPGRYFVLLDAWVALGKDGVLDLVSQRLGVRPKPCCE